MVVVVVVVVVDEVVEMVVVLVVMGGDWLWMLWWWWWRSNLSIFKSLQTLHISFQRILSRDRTFTQRTEKHLYPMPSKT